MEKIHIERCSHKPPNKLLGYTDSKHRRPKILVELDTQTTRYYHKPPFISSKYVIRKKKLNKIFICIGILVCKVRSGCSIVCGHTEEWGLAAAGKI
jgi:hypothetical protein